MTAAMLESGERVYSTFADMARSKKENVSRRGFIAGTSMGVAGAAARAAGALGGCSIPAGTSTTGGVW